MRAMFRAFPLVLACAAAPAAALQLDSDPIALEALAGWREGGERTAGLRVTLDPGWKTYWRAPGEAGLAPVFDWSASRGVSDVEVEWPAPETFDDAGYTSIGYTGSFVLPLRMADAGQGGVLAGSVELGVCDEVCIPVTLDFSADLPAAEAAPDPEIVAALRRRPVSAEEAGVTAVSCRISPAGDGVLLRSEVALAAAGASDLLVVEVADPRLWAFRSETTASDGVLVNETELHHSGGLPVVLSRAQIRLTVLGEGLAVDIRGCPAAG